MSLPAPARAGLVLLLLLTGAPGWTRQDSSPALLDAAARGDRARLSVLLAGGATSATTSVTETDPNGNAPDRLTIPGLTNGALGLGGQAYVPSGRSGSFGASPLTASGSTITAAVGGTCSGTACGQFGAGVGTFAFTPDPGITDLAGNPVAGTFTTPSTFRLF